MGPQLSYDRDIYNTAIVYPNHICLQEHHTMSSDGAVFEHHRVFQHTTTLVVE